MFVPAQGVSNTYVRKIAFEITLGGLLIWVSKNILWKIYNIIDFSYESEEKNAYVAIYIIDYCIQGVVWFYVYITNF